MYSSYILISSLRLTNNLADDCHTISLLVSHGQTAFFHFSLGWEKRSRLYRRRGGAYRLEIQLRGAYSL